MSSPITGAKERVRPVHNFLLGLGGFCRRELGGQDLWSILAPMGGDVSSSCHCTLAPLSGTLPFLLGRVCCLPVIPVPLVPVGKQASVTPFTDKNCSLAVLHALASPAASSTAW